ncbi:hypothetical protein T484DRAFT_3109761 [Baffinella frigidus]|nr:hypothetical protein T484DRAFT_3109761 [Cryptophyta sp. CCMP2293]
MSVDAAQAKAMHKKVARTNGTVVQLTCVTSVLRVDMAAGAAYVSSRRVFVGNVPNIATYCVTSVLRVDVAAGAAYVSSRCVFVGNVPFSKATEEHLRQIFKPVGEIENVRMIRDKVTGLGKGFGFVQFAKEESVEAAVNLRKREVKPAIMLNNKVFELRISAAMKPTELSRSIRLRNFVKKVFHVTNIRILPFEYYEYTLRMITSS